MPNLILFFTKGNSLKFWSDVGMFDREVALYQKLQAKGYDISFITYGDKSDLEFASKINGINILYNKWKLPNKLYHILIPILHAKHFKKADILKTNQTNGAEIALFSAKLWQKPLIARCGYMWSEFTAKQKGEKALKTVVIKMIEKIVFLFADKVVVTTKVMQDDIKQRINKAYFKTIVIPNYVETKRFKPNDTQKDFDLMFLGRFSEQKNLKSLLEAIKNLNIKVLFVGDGELKPKFQNDYKDLKNITWLDKVPNKDLPNAFNKSKIYILPSFYEGNPKTLIEAMACGLPVIGTNVVGIKEVISNNENGLLCETDSESIKSAIIKLLEDEDLCKKLGSNARKFALEKFALDKIVEMEMNVYNSLIGN